MTYANVKDLKPADFEPFCGVKPHAFATMVNPSGRPERQKRLKKQPSYSVGKPFVIKSGVFNVRSNARRLKRRVIEIKRPADYGWRDRSLVGVRRRTKKILMYVANSPARTVYTYGVKSKPHHISDLVQRRARKQAAVCLRAVLCESRVE
jgi:hypothetical protein